MKAANSNKLKQARRLRKAGKLEQAIATCEKLVKRSPDRAAAHFELALSYADLGRPEQVIAHCNRAIESGLHRAEVFATNARALNAVRNYHDAETMARAAVTLSPDHAPGARELVRALLPQGKYDAALPLARQLVQQAPDSPRDRIALAWVLVSREDYDGAIAQGRKALQLDPGSAEARYLLSRIYRLVQQWDLALEMANEALVLAPQHPEYIAMQAYDLVAPLTHQDRPQSLLAIHVYARLARRFGEQTRALELLERSVTDIAASLSLRQTSHHLLASAYDALGDYDKAFTALARANNLRPNNYNEGHLASYMEQITSFFDGKGAGRHSTVEVDGPAPIFIVGMPRSGTSLTEQILARHRLVHAGGETISLPMMLLRDLPQLLGYNGNFPDFMDQLSATAVRQATATYLTRLYPAGAGDDERVTDKRPMNFMYLGAIARLFPRARIIHCTRDPLDIGLSCYFANFASSSEMGFTQDLQQIGRYYKRYEQMMAHWHAVLDVPILDLSYEALVSEPESEIARLLAFCDLPWDDACLSPDQSTGITMSASYEQVRRPINTRSIGRWKLYDRHLAPLKQTLGLSASEAA